jgi:hypothetical protein
MFFLNSCSVTRKKKIMTEINELIAELPEGIDPRLYEALLKLRQPLSELHPYFKCCVYGDSGFGKTVWAMKLAQAITPPDKTIEFVDHMEGWVSLANHKGLRDRAHRQKYTGFSQVEFLAEVIAKGVKPFDNIGTVILDEFSSMTYSDLDIVVKAARKDVPEWPDYYAGQERARRCLEKLLSQNINVITVAHIREDKLSSGAVVTRPKFLPGFNDIFRQMMHLVTYLSADEYTTEEGSMDYRRSFQVHPTKKINAKTRVGHLHPVVDGDYLIGAIWEWMNGERESNVTDVIVKDKDEAVEEPEESADTL